MAKKRMFNMQIVDSGAFLEMPLSAQCLYFHLNMRADDDGFIDNAKSIMRMICASEDDLKLLIAKRFVLTFDTGIIVIKHWRLHNTLKSDRYTPTNYVEEKSMLTQDKNKGYSLDVNKMVPKCFQNDSTDKDIDLDIDKDLGIDKDLKVSNKSTKFIKPTLNEVIEYCHIRDNNIDAQSFIDYYDSVGWKVGKKPMKDWKACIRTWERKDKDSKSKSGAIDWDEV